MLTDPPTAACAVPHIPWDNIDTVLVDMDGTLLDLAFDNFFRLELVPRHYAARRRLPEAAARQELMQAYQALEGQLAWYCVDHWTAALGIDLRALSRQHSERICYLPMAPEFLAKVRARGKRLILATNAHRDVLALKVERTGLDREVDALVSSHDFRAPKESQEFWQRFQDCSAFDSERTMLVEDSLSVLAAARAFGLGFTLAIKQPDSSQPPRDISEFPAIDGVYVLAAD